MTTTIRRAVLADAEHGGPVHAQLWREPYRGILSDEWITSVSDEQTTSRWRIILGEPNPARLWVALVDGTIVGFAAALWVVEHNLPIAGRKAAPLRRFHLPTFANKITPLQARRMRYRVARPTAAWRSESTHMLGLNMNLEPAHDPAIRRWATGASGRSRTVAFGGLVWTVATATDTTADFNDQAVQSLEMLAANLIVSNSSRARLLSLQVLLSDISQRNRFDTLWNEWIGPNPDHWPQRACFGAELAPGLLIEMIAVAASEPAPNAGGRSSAVR